MVLLTTQERFEDHETVQTLGLVRGNVGWARNVGKDVLALLRTAAGGEINEYTDMFAEARQRALDRMIEKATELGANGVVCIRFTTSPVMPNTAEFLAYGTAVILRKKGSDTT